MSRISANKSWRTVTMNDLAAAVPNALAIGPFGSDLKTTDYVDDGVPVVFVKNIKPNMYSPAGGRFVSEEKAEQLAAHKVIPGDLIITKMGLPPCVTAIYPDDTQDGIVTADIIKLTPNPTCVDARYISYFLNSAPARSQVEAFTNGVTRPKVTLGAFRSMWIPLPPLSEQKRIADILDKVDAIRRKRQEALDTLSALRSSVFLRLFGDPRSGRSDWFEVNLGDVTVLDAPMVDPREEEHVDLVHLGPDRIEKNTGRLLPALTAREEGLISGKFLFDERYLLYSKIRPYLRKVALPHFKGLCSADVYPIRPVENVTTREYLFALLISEAFLSYTTSLASRASIPKLNRKELAAYTFRLPPLELQQQYTEILRSHERTTETFCKAADESEHLFNALVQRAFKGEL